MVDWVRGGGLDTMRELCGIWVSWWTVPIQPGQAAGVKAALLLLKTNV